MAIKKNRVITRRALNIFSSKVDFELMKSDFQAMADSRGFGFKIILDILTDNYAAPSDSMDFEDWINATGHKRATFKFIFDDSNEDLGWSTEVIKRSTDGRLFGSSCFVYQGGGYQSLATSNFGSTLSSSGTFIPQMSLSPIASTTSSYLFYGFVINDFATALTSLFCGAASDQVNFQFSDTISLREAHYKARWEELYVTLQLRRQYSNQCECHLQAQISQSIESVH